jgi:hypothetical protein
VWKKSLVKAGAPLPACFTLLLQNGHKKSLALVRKQGF